MGRTSGKDVREEKKEAITAYGDVEKILAQQIREAALDHEAFAMPLAICELGSCRATCCHDGVNLSADQAGVISNVVDGHREQLKGYGWDHPQFLTEEKGRPRSITLPAEPEELARDFPAHFPKTRCVFLDDSHRCVLQRLAMDEDRHPWFWKPVSCWLFPLILQAGTRGGRPLLTLARPGKDPTAKEGYPGFSSCAPCGIAKEGGKPAWEVLRGELELLGKIGGRDLVRELAG
jgi:hypothetical protein